MCGRKLRPEVKVGVVVLLAVERRAGGGARGEDALGLKVCVSVDQLALLPVNQQSEVSEIGSEDVLLSISDDGDPR